MTFHSQEFDDARDVAFQTCAGEFWMPQLRENMIYSELPRNIYAGGSIDTYTNYWDYLVLYGQTANEESMEDNILWFFVDDAKFWSTWYKMAKFIEKLQDDLRPRACLLPNYSLWRDDPLPEQQYNWYKTMLVWRIWQEMGIMITPVLNWWSPESYKFAWHGIPKNLPLVWCQCRNTRVGEESYFVNGLKAMYENLHFETVAIYWWYENPKLMELCKEACPWLKIVPFMSWNTKKRKIEKLNQGKKLYDDGTQRWHLNRKNSIS